MISSYETAIRSSNWHAIREMFIPGARILYEENQTRSQYEFDEWLDSLRISVQAVGYTRQREVQEIKRHPERGYVTVLCTLTETLLVSGGRRKLIMDELMLVARTNEGLRIGSLGFKVVDEDLVPLSSGEGR